MKTAIIIHGLPSREEYYDPNRPAASSCHWLSWLQRQLLLNNILAQNPVMPIAYKPEYNSWREMFERFPLNEETILIGHSCGAGFIVRYLSENNIKVGKVVLVAPWIDPNKFLDTRMFDFEIDKNVVLKTEKLVIFSSSNDDIEVVNSIKKLKDAILNLKIVEFKNKGHFCYNDLGTDAFPELLEEVLK